MTQGMERKKKVTISLSPRVLALVDTASAGGSRSDTIEQILRRSLVERAWDRYAADLSRSEVELFEVIAEESEEATAVALTVDGG